MMENESIGKRGMGINYKGSQGQTKRAVVLQEEEEEWQCSLQLQRYCACEGIMHKNIPECMF
jgi:hypothetical protein